MYLDSDYGGPAPSPRRARRAMRDDLSDIIERALAMLDNFDCDPDLEPAGDELDFSASERWLPGDMRAANEDAEPSLGWCEDRSRRGLLCPTRIDDGEPDDFREDDDPQEDGGDLEPSLGAPEPGPGLWSQIGWLQGGDADLEEGNDNGIADSGGFCEQFRGEGGVS